MALSITSNFSGVATSGFINASVAGAPVIKEGKVTFHQGIKDDLNISLASATHGIVSHACSFSAAGNYTLTESVLTPTKLKVNKEYCIDDLESHWISSQMQAGQWAGQPADFSRYIIQYQSALVSESLEQAIFRADSAGATSTYFDDFDGLLKTAKTGANVITGSAAFTTANLVGFFGDALENVPAAVLQDRSQLMYFASPNTWSIYERAVAENSYETYVITERPQQYRGIPIVVTNGMPDDELLLARKSDLHVGTDLVSDYNEVRLIDMRENEGSDNVRVVMKFKVGTAIPYPDQVVSLS